jgi:hypothetical protein
MPYKKILAILCSEGRSSDWAADNRCAAGHSFKHFVLDSSTILDWSHRNARLLDVEIDIRHSSRDSNSWLSC